MLFNAVVFYNIKYIYPKGTLCNTPAKILYNPLKNKKYSTIELQRPIRHTAK